MPKGKLRLDLENLKNILEKLQFKTKAYTGSLLSTEKGCKINIYLSGKIVIITRNEEQFVELKEELSSVLYTYTKAD
jgi:TATA-box binding protein (TBP) (component of TFIID and TFIIIB)